MYILMADDLGKIVNLTIMDMLMLEPECPLNLHIVDSDQMGIDLLPGILQQVPTNFVIGVPTAAIRHKIAFNLGVEPSSFSFIRDNKSDLEKVLPSGSSLLLWDYLNLSQPLAQKIVYRGWDQVDLVVILRNMVTPAGQQNTSLHNLIMPGA